MLWTQKKRKKIQLELCYQELWAYILLPESMALFVQIFFFERTDALIVSASINTTYRERKNIQQVMESRTLSDSSDSWAGGLRFLLRPRFTDFSLGIQKCTLLSNGYGRIVANQNIKPFFGY